MVAFLRQTLEDLWNLLRPPRYFAWQTVIYMSLFSWLMSLLARAVGATAFTIGLLATISWICLALGVGWALEANRVRPFGIPIAPWVSGGIVCIFLFGSWGGRWLQPALVSWPLVSFVLMAVPTLVSWDLDFKKPPPPVRQQLALLFCLSLLFSSWFQFYFRIQSWVRDYPSLVADSVDNSAFVYRLPGQAIALPAGVNHLTAAEAVLQEQVNGKPWPAVERWLLNLDGQRQNLQRQVQRQMGRDPSLEDSLWRFDFQPLSNGAGYILKLWAIWDGPAASPEGYYLEKSCLLMPVSQGTLDRRSLTQGSSRQGTLGQEPLSQGTLGQEPLSQGTLGQGEDIPPGYTTTQWASLTCDLETPRQAGHPRAAERRS